jgi:excisionase family DNA binding protein
MVVSSPKNNLVTAREVAARFGVAVSTVRVWVRQRRIPCVRFSRKVIRFDLAAVERAVAQTAQGGANG